MHAREKRNVVIVSVLLPIRRRSPKKACVLLLQDLLQWGGQESGGHVLTRNDEPRPVWTSLPITHRKGAK